MAKERIAHLDGFRGLAILLVISYHAFARWPEITPWTTAYGAFPIFKFGKLGVQLFFVISGYVIFMTLERCTGLFEFLYKRWLRLFPAMLLGTIIVFSSAKIFYERPAGGVEWIDTVAGLILIDPIILNDVFNTQFSSLEGSFWSLYVEVKFYLIFGFFYFLNRSKALQLLIGVFLIGFLYKIITFSGLLPRTSTAERVLFSWLSLNHFGWFCIGALLFRYQKARLRGYPILALVLFPIALYMTVGGKNMPAAVFGCLLFASFWAALASNLGMRFLCSRALNFFGFVSYPLYLIHENMMVAMIVKTHRSLPWLPDILTPVPGLLAIIAAAYCIARFAEPALQSILRGIPATIKRTRQRADATFLNSRDRQGL